MFSPNVHAELKQLTKDLNTTQASLVNALVQFALDNCNPAELSLETAKKRGRKPGTTNKRPPEAAVAVEAKEVESKMTA